MTPPQLTHHQATQHIRAVLKAAGCNVPVPEPAVVVTDDAVLFGFHDQGHDNALFDFVFPRAPSGTYYQYLPYDVFQLITTSGKLRFYSTKKLTSIGDFRPFCIDYDLDGYGRGRFVRCLPVTGRFRKAGPGKTLTQSRQPNTLGPPSILNP